MSGLSIVPLHQWAWVWVPALWAAGALLAASLTGGAGKGQ